MLTVTALPCVFPLKWAVRFGCKFCASGLLGLTRNLTTAEIVGQIVAAEEISGERVDNLVFMGMGEPLANMDNLLPALTLIMDQQALNIGARHITISTSGNVPGLKRLAALRQAPALGCLITRRGR